jgi:hypothetical protein
LKPVPLGTPLGVASEGKHRACVGRIVEVHATVRVVFVNTNPTPATASGFCWWRSIACSNVPHVAGFVVLAWAPIFGFRFLGRPRSVGFSA